MDNNIGSENPVKQQLAILLEEDEDGISVPNWLVDVLKWITRIEMANSSLSFSCKLFKRLCWPKLHGDVEPHIVRRLEFCYEPNKSGNICVVLKDRHRQIIPIAAISPPEYIHGFKWIIIRLLDNKVIEFIKNITFEEKILLKTHVINWQNYYEQFTLLQNLLPILVNNIYRLEILNHSSDANLFLNYYRQFSTFINKVPFLFVSNIVDLDLDILFNWVMKPLADGKQKVFRYDINFDLVNIEQEREMELRFINRIKEEFSQSKERNNFLVQLFNVEYEQFILQNEQTREVLNLYQEMIPEGGLRILMARYPKGEEDWKEGSEEKIYGKRKTCIRLM